MDKPTLTEILDAASHSELQAEIAGFDAFQAGRSLTSHCYAQGSSLAGSFESAWSAANEKGRAATSAITPDQLQQ